MISFRFSICLALLLFCWFENISSIISFYVIFGFWRQLKAAHRRWKSDIVQPALRLILIFLRECVQYSGGSSVKSRRIMISSDMEMCAHCLFRSMCLAAAIDERARLRTSKVILNFHRTKKCARPPAHIKEHFSLLSSAKCNWIT